MINKVLLALASLLISAGSLAAGDKSLMHCFAFTDVAEAAAADWKAWEEATEKLPKQIPGLMHVWYGKLSSPLGQVQVAAQQGEIDKPTIDKFRAGEVINAPIKRLVRQHGACFQFKDKAAFDAYSKSPVHDEWTKLYAKVRVDGTTTFQILGQ